MATGKTGSKQRKRPIQKHAGRKVSRWAKLFIPLLRGPNGFGKSFTALCVTFQKILGIGRVRGRFSVDRRSPSKKHAFVRTLSLFSWKRLGEPSPKRCLEIMLLVSNMDCSIARASFHPVVGGEHTKWHYALKDVGKMEDSFLNDSWEYVFQPYNIEIWNSWKSAFFNDIESFIPKSTWKKITCHNPGSQRSFVALSVKKKKNQLFTPAAACLFLFYDLLFSAFEAVGPLSALSATQRAMLRSSLLSADCNSIFLPRFSHENLPNLYFLNLFPSMFHSHCPLSACTHFFTDTCYLFTYFWQMHTHTHTHVYIGAARAG